MPYLIVMKVVSVMRLRVSLKASSRYYYFQVRIHKNSIFYLLGELVMVSHETKHAHEQSGGSGKNFTTSLICENIAHDTVPPFIIYPSKYIISP